MKNYEIIKEIGDGTYGIVYEGINKETKQKVAIKKLKEKFRCLEDCLSRKEVKALEKFNHENIVKLKEVIIDNKGEVSYIFEYCDCNLLDFIDNHRQHKKWIPEPIIRDIVFQISKGVKYIHSKQYFHRDLKPENIVLMESEDKDIFIKLIDFGTSITIKGKNLTQELGTIYYIAPEVFMNNYNEKADIWSCGIILYTMLCGHPPFCGNKENIIKSKILHSKLTFPSKEFKTVSSDAKDYIKSLLSYDPSKRPSAEEALNNEWLMTMNARGKAKLSDYIISNLIRLFHSKMIAYLYHLRNLC